MTAAERAHTKAEYKSVLDLAIRVFEGNAQPQTLDSRSYKYVDILREIRNGMDEESER